VNKFEEKIKYFFEKQLEVQKAINDATIKGKAFDDEFGPWLKGLTGGDNVHIVELMKKALDSAK
jgi:hypothetical protein